VRSLSEIVRPDWRLSDWVLQVEVLIDDYTICLEFPEDLGGFGVHLSGSLPLGAAKGLNKGDWIRFSAVADSATRPTWWPGKGFDSISIGELTLTKVERLSPPITTTSGN
jgi:hypothetical protein